MEPTERPRSKGRGRSLFSSASTAQARTGPGHWQQEIGRSPWTRDGAMALFTCIRTKAEAQGYYYE